jgi:hypothetical protein
MISSLAVVRFLDIDNVQGLGPSMDGKPLITINQQNSESDAPKGSAEARHRDTMSGNPGLIQTQFTNLRHLCIRTVGQGLADDPGWIPQRDEDRYEELAPFIDCGIIFLKDQDWLCCESVLFLISNQGEMGGKSVPAHYLWGCTHCHMKKRF